MSFFNFGRKKNNNENINNISNEPSIKLNNEPSIDLKKEQSVNELNLRKEVLSVSLKKNNLNDVHARVAVVLDKSGSMRSLYNNGLVQQTLERLLPIALEFDDDGELDMWLFADKAKRINCITEKDFFGFVDNEITNKRENNFWGGTNYAPVMKDVFSKYIEEEPNNTPTYVVFITDGDNFDKQEAEEVIRQTSKYNIFWQFVGIGGSNFSFLEKLDDMSGRFIDNANFFEINNLNKISDKELYDKLLNEYPDWVKEAKQKGLIN